MANDDPKLQEPAAGGPKGEPDDKQKLDRLEAENASLKAERDSLTKQLEEEKAAREKLDKQLADALTEEDVKAAVEKARDEAKKAADEAEEAWKGREKRLTVENALIAAGCIDAKAAMSHVDMDKVEVAADGHISGLDTKALAEARPYLFNASNAGTASAKEPGGGAKKTMTRKEIAEIEDPKERQRLIAENLAASDN